MKEKKGHTLEALEEHVDLRVACSTLFNGYLYFGTNKGVYVLVDGKLQKVEEQK